MAENDQGRPESLNSETAPEEKIIADSESIQFDSASDTGSIAPQSVPRDIEDFPDLRVVDNAYARALWDAEMIALDGLAEAIDKIFWWAELLAIMTNPASEPDDDCRVCVTRWEAELCRGCDEI